MRVRRSVVAVFATFVLHSVHGGEDAYDVLDQATEFAQAGNLPSAAHLFARILGDPAMKRQLPKQHLGQTAFNYGFTLLRLGQCEKAIPQFDIAIDAVPTLSDAYMKAAWCANELGSPPLAAGYLRAATKVITNNPVLFQHLGDMLNNIKRFEEAVAAYMQGIAVVRARFPTERAAAADPTARGMLTKLFISAGDAHINTKNATGAIRRYLAAKALSPLDPELLASLLHSRLDACDWTDYERDVHLAIKAAMRQVAGGKHSSLTPYHGLFVEMEEQTKVALTRSILDATVAAAIPRAPVALYASRLAASTSRQTLTLGYLSRRFEHYPGAQLMLRMFGSHDRSRVHVVCFASGPDDGSMERSVIRRDCDAFHDVSLLTASDTAALIASHAVDVLIDYDGMHDFNNMRVLALRPAPVQASFLGFGGTTGAPRSADMMVQRPDKGTQRTANPVDFLIADPIIVPVEISSSLASESIWYMPHTYQPQDPEQALSQPRPQDAASLQALRTKVRAAERLEWPANTQPASINCDLEDDAVQREGQGEHNIAQNGECATPLAPLRTEEVGEGERAALPILSPVVAVSFNRWTKLDPVLWTVWMNALRRNPRMLLWIYGGQPVACVFGEGTPECMAPAAAHIHALWREAGAHGISPRRIIFAPMRPRAEHLTRHYAADVMLDSRVYGAHTTSVDGFYSGLPAVTLPASSFSSRVGAALALAIKPGDALSAIGIVHTLSAYEDVAVRLTSDCKEGALRRQHTLIEAAIRTTCAARGSSCGNALPSSSASNASLKVELNSAGAELHPASRNEGEEVYHTGLFDALGFTRDFERLARAAYEVKRFQFTTNDTLSLGSAVSKAFHIVLPARGMPTSPSGY